jgi:hypothetical protein
MVIPRCRQRSDNRWPLLAEELIGSNDVPRPGRSPTPGADELSRMRFAVFTELMEIVAVAEQSVGSSAILM